MEQAKELSEKTQRDGLDAAFRILRPLVNEEDVAIYTKAILRALKEVKAIEAKADSQANDDEYVLVDPAHIVASALWAVAVNLDDDEEVHPHSIGATPFLAFAKACMALEAAANFRMAVFELQESPLLGDHADEVLEAIEMEEKGEKARNARGATETSDSD